MTMSQEAKDGTCKALEGKTIKTMVWQPHRMAEIGCAGYWVMTFTDGSEICFNLMMAELV